MEHISSSSSVLQAGSLPLPAANYEVFLSFRGPDVRSSFASSLYRFLDNDRIRTFYDDEELRKGEEMDTNLIKAIEESKIYIPIFSPDYVSSKWCLLELAHMVKCYKKRKGHLILPIFYMVEPRDVRRREGPFQRVFAHLEKYGQEIISEWEEALQTAGKRKGWPVTVSDNQGDIINEVSAMVWLLLKKDFKILPSKLVGMHPHVEQVKGRLNKDVKIVGIHGMSGIGKTTIAKAVYNHVSAEFNRCCFVEDVRDILSKSDGIVTLQNMILSGILRKKTEVTDASDGIDTIKNRVCSWSSVLIVLDDVGESFKFEKTLGDLRNFSLESRFIITTVDKKVVDDFQQYELYQPGEMSDDDALQLFSKHAFGMDYPRQDYLALSQEFVKVCAGLPVALEIIGSNLFGYEESFWIAKLEEWKYMGSAELFKKLKIFYRELTREQKRIFLDIALYFAGEPCDRPIYLWSDLGLHPNIAIHTLCRKMWVKINERDEFLMHDHYKSLARDIVGEETPSLNPWERSRIWSNEETLDMLRDKEGTHQLHILRVDMKDEDFELTDQEFKKLSGLRFLEVRNGRLTGDFTKILPNIRWLRLHNCSSIPVDFSLKKLVVLDLWRCSIRDDWKGWNQIKVAPKLKVVAVLSCKDLNRVPQLSQCRSLEHLDLHNCEKMRGELQVGNFENLKVMKLGFTKITKLAGDIGILKNLQEIDAEASFLIEVPAGIGKLSSLKSLDLRSNNLQSKELPILPISLKRLYLSSPRVPNLLELKDLEELWFSNCDAPEIPGDVSKLSKLKTLKLSDCPCEGLLGRTALGDPPALPASLNSLVIERCAPLMRLPNLSNLNSLTELVMTQVGVREIVGLGQLRLLKALEISYAPNLVDLNGLEQLDLLKTLHLKSCDVLGRLPSLSNLTQLHVLEIQSCGLIPEIPGLDQMVASLSSLKISGCPILVASILPSLSKLTKLTKLSLDFFGADSYHLLPHELVLDLSSLQDIEELSISGCKQLTEVNGVERLESLRLLHLSRCESIRKLPDFSDLKNLICLEILRCTLLTEVKGLEKLESFQSLDMSGCTSMKELPSLYRNVTFLNVSGCKQITELNGLEKLDSLQFLCISKCTLISKLPDLFSFKDFVSLDLRGCTLLTEVTGIERLEGLLWLQMDGRLRNQYRDLMRVIENRRIHRRIHRRPA